jgi:hypothetical protein
MKEVRDKSTKCRICPDPMIGLVGIAMAEVATALGAPGEAVPTTGARRSLRGVPAFLGDVKVAENPTKSSRSKAARFAGHPKPSASTRWAVRATSPIADRKADQVLALKTHCAVM